MFVLPERDSLADGRGRGPLRLVSKQSGARARKYNGREKNFAARKSLPAAVSGANFRTDFDADAGETR
jgi:hypothetical protein